MKNNISTLLNIFATTLLLAGCASLEPEVKPVVEPQPEPVVEPQPVVKPQPEPVKETKPMICMKTTLGDIKLELDAEKAPNTVANFLQYVESGHYNGTIFHRVIDNFMIQGGGFTADMVQKNAPHAVDNEANNGLKNDRGTLAMARTSAPHSAGAQFFINVKDNGFLNFSAPTPQGWGYCVFGKVIEGMEIVDAIKGVPTGRGDVPNEPITITEVTVCD